MFLEQIERRLKAYADSLKKGTKMQRREAPAPGQEKTIGIKVDAETYEALLAFMKRRGIKTMKLAAVEAIKSGLSDSHSMTFDFATFFDMKAQWSKETFGPGDRLQGVLKHIRKELVEIEKAPADLVEWVDVLMLAVDGAWRSAGADGAAFVKAMVAKHRVNILRPWPDWRTTSADEPIEHVRTEG